MGNNRRENISLFITTKKASKYVDKRDDLCVMIGCTLEMLQ